ncbi:SurA N-terminal domain-containing protein [Zhihengliuella salsuginis]|uniref:Peptidylprolyl isomerase n=1 Tax=Zhihengliuella salsuginis TaxID=578222 RepID=A0ABQ3GJE8_9MICC|nr:SurA N-terminal domain-containing protein [Zhihengliuella salsuginis]GHD05360.1 hypothetical protein GCM10008096_14150 [Zhihengliuella salsuginis]
MSKSKKTLAALALVGSLSMVAACGAEGEQGAAQSQGQEASQESGQSAAAPSPDLGELPDVVATVNGEEIDKDEFSRVYEIQFQQAAMQSQMSGEAPDQEQLKKDVAESLVGTELLVQRAEEKGLAATDDQISKALGEAAKSNEMSEDEFLAALEKQGTDRKQVDVQLKQQVEVQAVVAEEVGELTATEEELKTAYEEQKAMQEQMPAESGEAPEVPAFDEVKSQLEQQIVQQKESAATQELVEKLRADSDVEIKL